MNHGSRRKTTGMIPGMLAQRRRLWRPFFAAALGFVSMPLGAVLAGSVSAILLGIMSHLYLPEMTCYIVPVLSFVLGLIAARALSKVLNLQKARGGSEKECFPFSDETSALPNLPESKENRLASREDEIDNVIAFETPPRRDSRPEQMATELGHYPLFTDMLSKQMQTVTEISEGAAKGILENLIDIDNRITSLLGFIQQSGSNDRAARVVAEIEKQTQECRDRLDFFASEQEAGAQNGRLHRSKIASETGKVMEVLDGVNGVARQTTMLSLNVSIEAARAGEAGRGFAIIGEEIRKLAGEVQDLAKQVRDRIEALTRMITIDLRQEAEERDRTERVAIANIGEILNALTDNLLTLITHQRDILCKVESENESIARPILEMMGSIQFQDIIRQQLEHMTHMAGMVNDHICSVRDLLSNPDAEPQMQTLSEKLDNLFESYVMESQRASHRSVQGQSAAQDVCAKIELF